MKKKKDIVYLAQLTILQNAKQYRKGESFVIVAADHTTVLMLGQNDGLDE